MSARARRRFEQIMARHPDVAQAVSRWAERAMPIALSLPPQTLSARSWTRLADTLRFGEAPASKGNASATDAAPPRRWWQRWFAPVPAGALAMGLALGLCLPIAVQNIRSARTDMQLPESYVGVLGTPQGKPGLIVSSLRRGTVVDLKVVTAVPVPAGHHLHLWRIDKEGVPTALGPLPPANQGQIVHMTLPQAAEEAFFPAVELAVSVESDSQAPQHPTQPFVYRGLCGKVWK